MNEDNFNIIYKIDYFCDPEEMAKKASLIKHALNNNKAIVFGPGENVLIINKNGDMAALGDIKLSKIKEIRCFIDKDGNIKSLEEGEDKDDVTT